MLKLQRVARFRSRFRPGSLDALNFLLADVRGALGPYLTVFLVTQQGWSLSAAGLMTAVGGLAGLAAQTPIGAAIDATPHKRGVLAVCLAGLAVGALVIVAAPTFWPVLAANTVMAVIGDAFGPAVAALTLGLFARRHWAQRMGRNGAFDHAGNVAIAAVAGGVAWLFGQRALFLMVPPLAALAGLAVWSIPPAAIDHERARDSHDTRETIAALPRKPPSGWRALLKQRPLAAFAVGGLLFHFANAPLLPLVGQKLALANQELATAMMSACIIAAQLVMLPVALLAAQKAEQWGRKPVLLIGCAILVVRAVLYTVSSNSAWLLGVQLLDGVGAGIWGVLTPLIVADVMAGTGQYNVALGAVTTAHGAGGAVSGLAAGVIVDHYGYNAAFMFLAVASVAALAVLHGALPETRDCSDTPCAE